MFDYTKEMHYASLKVVDKIADIDVRDFVRCVDQPFLTLEVAFFMAKIFRSCILLGCQWKSRSMSRLPRYFEWSASQLEQQQDRLHDRHRGLGRHLNWQM